MNGRLLCYVRGFTQLPQKRKAATYFEGPGGHGRPLLAGSYVTQRVRLAYSKPGTSTGPDRRRAQLKCNLLTGSYVLQANRAFSNQFKLDPTCNLCSIAPETCQCYIVECSVFEIERGSFKEKVCNYLPLRECDPVTFTRLVLDSSAVFNHDVIDQSVISQTEKKGKRKARGVP